SAQTSAFVSRFASRCSRVSFWAKAARESRAYSPRRKRSCSLMLLIIYAPHYHAYTYNANHGTWSIGAGGQRSMIQREDFISHRCFSPRQRSLIAIGDSDLINVRFGPLCRLKSDILRGPRSATSGPEQVQQTEQAYSITSSASASTL